MAGLPPSRSNSGEWGVVACVVATAGAAGAAALARGPAGAGGGADAQPKVRSALAAAIPTILILRMFPPLRVSVHRDDHSRQMAHALRPLVQHAGAGAGHR